MANAGRILILAKGAWEALTNYVQLDLVTRNGIAYIARRASVGVDPALDVSFTNWMPFGSAAEIATTVSPGLVMPDGTSITVTSTGLIKAVLGIDDLTDVDVENPLTNQVLRYDGTNWTNITLGTAADKSTTNAVTQSSTALVESGAVYDEIATVNSSIQTLTNNKADKTDLTSIFETGTTASQTISNGEYFYLNGVLVRAISDIASGATFTLDTNYEAVTVGGLNELNSAIATKASSNDLNNLLDRYPDTIKMFNVATDGTRVGVSIGYPQESSFAAIYFDTMSRVAIITKLANQAPTLTMLNSSFLNSSLGLTSSQLRVGNYVRATLIINSAYIGHIDAGAY